MFTTCFLHYLLSQSQEVRGGGQVQDQSPEPRVGQDQEGSRVGQDQDQEGSVSSGSVLALLCTASS